MYPVSTLTFNPCIDKSTTIPSLMAEKKLRCTAPKFEPGGGGINVARVLKRFGTNALAIYPAGGYSGRFLTALLSNENIPSHCVETESHTRENLIVLEQSTNQQYRFGMPGTAITENECEQCLKILEQHDSEFIVVSGSMPPMLPDNIMRRIARVAKEKNKKLIVDTSGSPLSNALVEGVFMIKPNLRELGTLMNTEATLQNAPLLAKEIVASGKSKNVIVSLGKAGALLVSENVTMQYTPPEVKVLSTVGAGDSMVAGIVWKLLNGWTVEEAVRYGVACGTAATINKGTELCHVSDADALYNSIKQQY